MSTRKFATIGLLLAGLAFGGCDMMKKDKDAAAKEPTARNHPSGKSLYERLGREEAITKVVDDFVNNAANDPKVNFARTGRPNQWEATPENVRVLKRRLVEFIGSATGGPQKYTGKDMVTAHENMEITDAEFDALAGHLVNSLNKFGVPQAEQNELVNIVEGTRGAIVGQ